MQDERDREGRGGRDCCKGIESRDCTLKIKIIRMRAGESERGRAGGPFPSHNKNAWEISAC